MATDNFEFQLVGQEKVPFVGYETAQDKTTVTPSALIRGSKNVYKKLSGTIANRFGLKLRGIMDATLSATKSSYEWETSLGATRVLRVTAAGLMQVESNLSDGNTYQWYTIQTGLTLLRYIFGAWWNNTEKKDRLLMVHGDSNIQHWSGGLSRASAQVAGGNTLTKSSGTTTWAQDGFTGTAGELTFTINNDPITIYTYTGGQNSQILTGISPNLPTIMDGDIIVQAVLTSSNKPASGFINDFFKIIGNQVYMGSYTSRLVYISDMADFTSYAVPSPRIPGSPELLTLDAAARGISVQQKHAIIGDSRSGFYSISFQNITVSTTLTQQTIVDKVETAQLSGFQAHEFIDVLGDTVLYLDNLNQLRSIGAYRNLNQTKYPSLSLAIQTELEEQDFTGGHLRVIGDTIFITSPTTGIDYMYQVREEVDRTGNIISEKLWHPPQIRNVARYAVIDGIIYGHSNANPQIYQIFDTNQWHDDSPSGDPIGYDSVALFAYKDSGKPQALVSFDKTYFEGYMASGSNVYCILYFDYQGASGIGNYIINSIATPAIFFAGANAPSLGDSSLGDNPLGTGLTPESNDQELLPKFRAIRDVNPINNFEHAIEVWSSDPDARWELLSLGTNMTLATEHPVFLRA